MESFDEGYTGLTTAEPTLPAETYFSEAAFRRDLDSIWYRQWLYVCRAVDLAEPRSYQLVDIGNQQLIVLRDEHGELQAYHNTCRHRGSVLLTERSGTLRGSGITCPYHAWSYSLQGELKRTSGNLCQQGFEPASLSLYDVAIRDWRGFIFINLDVANAPPLEATMDCGGTALANWPLETLEVGYTFHKQMNCNWKIFWENFNECLHCPGVHPELSRLVPLYKQSMMELKDDPHWREHSASADPRFKPGLAPGAESWTADGKACDRTFENLTQEDIERGHTYEVLLPTVFMVGHVDYVRIVRLTPLSAEKTEVMSQWLFRPQTLAREDFDPAAVAAFAEMVLEQDARASELNQRGLHSLRHQQGTLMAEEYEVHAFQNWVRQQWQRDR